jgi:hypothetical protein
MLRSLNAAAMPTSDVTPADCSSRTIGAKSAARASARDWTALTLAFRAFKLSLMPRRLAAAVETALTLTGIDPGKCSRD